MQHWLDNGAANYPQVSWSELYQMLKDVGYSDVAKELQQAVQYAEKAEGS